MRCSVVPVPAPAACQHTWKVQGHVLVTCISCAAGFTSRWHPGENTLIGLQVRRQILNAIENTRRTTRFTAEAVDHLRIGQHKVSIFLCLLSCTTGFRRKNAPNPSSRRRRYRKQRGIGSRPKQLRSFPLLAHLDKLHEALAPARAVAGPVQLQDHGPEGGAVLHQGQEGVVVEPGDELDHHLIFIELTVANRALKAENKTRRSGKKGALHASQTEPPPRVADAAVAAAPAARTHHTRVHVGVDAERPPRRRQRDVPPVPHRHAEVSQGGEVWGVVGGQGEAAGRRRRRRAGVRDFVCGEEAR